MHPADKERHTGRTTRDLLRCFDEAARGGTVAYCVISPHFARWCLWLVQRRPFPKIDGVIDHTRTEIRFKNGGRLLFACPDEQSKLRGVMSRYDDHAVL